MTEQEIAKNLLLGHTCSNCLYQFEKIDVTTLVDTQKVYIPGPICNQDKYSNTCTNWSDINGK